MNNNPQVSQLDAQIKTLMEQRKSIMLREFSDEELAELLHEKKCKLHHEDQCGWFYEVDKPGKWTIEGSEHKRHLDKVKKIRKTQESLKENNIDMETLHKIHKIMIQNKLLNFNTIFDLEEIVE